MSLLQDLDYIRSQLGNLQTGLGVSSTTVITTIVPGAKYQYFSSLAAQPSLTLTPDLSQGYNVEVVLDTSSGVMGTPSNVPAAGSTVVYTFKQDGTGYRTISSWAATFQGVSHFAPRQGPNQYSSVTFVSDGTNLNLMALDGIDTTLPLNVRDFGAVGDGTTDDTAALRAWATSEINSTNTSGYGLFDRDLYLPHGQFVAKKPIVFSGANRLRGTGRGQSFFVQGPSGTFFGGQVLYVGEDSNTSQHRITTAASLLTGAGNSMRLDTSAPQWLNLRDSNCVEIGGSTAFTIECTIKIDSGDTSPNGGLVNILTAQKTDYSAAPIASPIGAFALQLFRVDATHYYIQAQLRTATSGLQLVDTGTQRFGPSTNVHVALTYDGAHAQLWVNGVQDASVAMTGGIVQPAIECIDLNGGVLGFPPAPLNAPTMQGWIDGIRFSNFARYTVGFTPPTSKPTCDSHTLLVINFDTFDGPYVVGSVSNGGVPFPAYMITRPTNPQSFNANNSFEDFGIVTGLQDGMLINGCTNFGLRHVEMLGPRNGIEVIGQTFSAVEYDDIIINTNGLANSAYCISAVGANGFSRFANAVLTGGVASMFAQGGFDIENVNFTPNSLGQYGLIAVGKSGFATLALRSSGIDYETNGTLVAGLVLQAMSVVTVDNCILDSVFSSGTPCGIIVEGTSGWGTRISVRETYFSGPNGWTWIQQNVSKPLATILLESCNYTPSVTATLSNNLGNIVLVNTLGLKSNGLAGTGSASGATATVTVTFSSSMPDTGYTVTLTPTTSTGTPAAGSNRVLSMSKTTSGFVATLEAAPGVGNTQNFDWVATRQ